MLSILLVLVFSSAENLPSKASCYEIDGLAAEYRQQKWKLSHVHQ